VQAEFVAIAEGAAADRQRLDFERVFRRAPGEYAREAAAGRHRSRNAAFADRGGLSAVDAAAVHASGSVWGEEARRQGGAMDPQIAQRELNLKVNFDATDRAVREGGQGGRSELEQLRDQQRQLQLELITSLKRASKEGEEEEERAAAGQRGRGGGSADDVWHDDFNKHGGLLHGARGGGAGGGEATGGCAAAGLAAGMGASTGSGAGAAGAAGSAGGAGAVLAGQQLSRLESTMEERKALEWVLMRARHGHSWDALQLNFMKAKLARRLQEQQVQQLFAAVCNCLQLLATACSCLQLLVQRGCVTACCCWVEGAVWLAACRWERWCECHERTGRPYGLEQASV
jgi:hypothetical protein